MGESIWTIIIPSLVTIIGFGINFILIAKEKNLDMSKHKNEEQIKKLIDIPTDILFYIDCYMKLIAKQSIDRKRFGEVKEHIFDCVLCYGSEDAVKILLYFKHALIQGIDDNVSVKNTQVIAPLVLLLMQVKYDITNVKTSPKVWYVDFMSQKLLETNFFEKSVEEMNKIVDLLGLNSFLKITDNGIY